MVVYIISRDGAGDGSGLIIKSSFNCILLHYNDVTKLARLYLSPSLSLCVLYITCMCARGGCVYGEHFGTSGTIVCFNPVDLESGTLKDSAACRTSVD